MGLKGFTLGEKLKKNRNKNKNKQKTVATSILNLQFYSATSFVVKKNKKMINETKLYTRVYGLLYEIDKYEHLKTNPLLFYDTNATQTAALIIIYKSRMKTLNGIKCMPTFTPEHCVKLKINGIDIRKSHYN